MKFAHAVIAIFALGCVVADPIQISDNNVGDIINVVANIEASIESNIDINIVNVLVAILLDMDNLDLSQLPPLPDLPNWPNLPPLNPREQQFVDAVVQKMKSKKH
ncbi:hypothetical protein RP20_CCG027857 [Aedes albopictus]|nr:hypothetical protein RP20_CCG027857 [Aedes albopictus]